MRRAVAAGLLLLLTAACGGGGGGGKDSPSAAPPSSATSGTSATSAPSSAVPSVTVRDVGTGSDVNLRALGLPDRPTLYWFWAPHWPYCAREAPGLEQFARTHSNEINIVGLGTQDSFGEAQAFVARHGVTFRMLWDRGFGSWNHFGIKGQPASILIARDGRELKRWIGPLDGDDHAEALRLAAG